MSYRNLQNEIGNKKYNIKDIQNIILNNTTKEYYRVYSKHEVGYWEHIPNWILKKDANNCLDIGAGYGTLALFTKLNKKCDVYVLDNQSYFDKEIANQYGINIKICNIETEPMPYKDKFDMIIMTEVFEHFNFYPIDVMLKIKKILTDDGIILFSTPDASSRGKCGKYKSWEDIPKYVNQQEYLDEHIYQYNLNELKDIFKMSGLKIQDCVLSTNLSNLKHFNMVLSKVI